MTYTGRVKNGVVVLDELHDGAEAPPEGAMVQVYLADERPTIAERLKNVIGKAEGMPADFAKNHDHYLHGTPKNEP